MADLTGLNFDARNEKPMMTFGTLPEGDYVAAIVASEDKPTKAGNGNSYLELKFQVLEGEFTGRYVWTRLNLHHHKSKVVGIAKRELGAIGRAINIPTPTDSTQLHNLPMQIHVVVKLRKDTKEPGNEINAYDKKPSAVAVNAAAGAGDDSPPWVTTQ